MIPLRSLLLVLLATVVGHSAPAPADFAKRLEVSNVQISETGRYVSLLTPSKERYFDLNLYDLETKKASKLNLGGNEVWTYWWIDGNRLVLNLANGAIQVYDADKNGITGTVRGLGMYLEYVSSLRRDPNLFVARFYEDRYGGNRHGLAVVTIKATPSLVNGANNERYNVKDWIEIPKGEHHLTFTDGNGNVRLVTIYKDKRLQLHYRTGVDGAWKELPLDPEAISIVGFADDPDFIYLSQYSATARSSSLYRYRVSTNELGEPLFEDPDYSLSEAGLMRVRKPDGNYRPLALGYHRDVYVQRPLDPEFAEIQRTINTKLPGRLNTITDCDSQLRYFVVSSSSGREPARYAIYDRANSSFIPLAAPAPWFKPAEMSVKRPLKFTTRDGLTLEGYLSLPPGLPPGTKPPLIVNPHGGPWARDVWGFDSDVQFLTSRGYAVFQPNYRGSTGYPKAVSKDQDFAFRKMHDDVTDGVKHVLSLGAVDDKRVAIYGGSFGGYLAIAGVAFEPNVYKCAITFAGVFDWKQMIKQHWAETDYDEFNYDFLLKKLGDPAKQQERFEEISPIGHVAAIKSPVFVVHGKLDNTVDYRQSTKLLSELKAHNVPHEKLFFDTEFHGFSEPENYEKFLGAVEKFLAKNL